VITLLLLGAATPCAAQEVLLSTYLGGRGPDQLTSAGIGSDGCIYLGGNLSGSAGIDRDILTEKGKGAGLLLRLDPAAGKVLMALRVNGAINDMDIDANGRVFITGAFGSASLDPTLKKVLWSSSLGGEESRISACGKGAAAVLAGKAIALIDSRGKKAASWGVQGNYVMDVACHPKLQHVYATGFDNKRGKPPGHQNYPVQVAFVYAYDFSGKQVWKGYGWKGQEVADLKLMADTRGYRLTVTGDKLYVAGESAGGNTMWARMSDDLDTNATMNKGDAFQSAHNTRANHITFVGRLDARTGKTEAGTMLLSRLSNGKGNTIRPRALAALPDGRVFVGGASASEPPISEGAYGKEFTGGGAFFCAFDKDFKRFFATKFCQGSTLGIAVKGSTFVAVGEGREHLRSRNAFMKDDHHERTKEAPDGWAVVLVKSVADAKKAAARLKTTDVKPAPKPEPDKTAPDSKPAPKPKPKPKPRAKSAEDLALAKLKVAKAYLSMGRWKMAHEELQELLDQYPDSEHAPEARKLLQKVKDRFR